MTYDESEVNNIEVLDRICDAYGFSQKMQLANHLKIAASSLSNRYRRGAISYDFAAICSFETGTCIKWLLTGKGSRHAAEKVETESSELELLTLSEGKLLKTSILSIDERLFSKPIKTQQCVKFEGKAHFIDTSASLSDGLWLVDIEGSASIRELALLPSRRIHVTGGKIPFECGIDEIKTLGRVVGIYAEVN